MYKKNIQIKVKNGKIINLSSFKNGVQIINENETLTFPNSIALPGFVDSHLHFFGTGEVGLMPDFRNCRNEDEMIDKIKEKTFYRNNWIIGFGWNQELFEDKKFPNKDKFDKAFPDTPLFLRRIDGHSALLNSKALEILEISASSTSPVGGIIVKDKSGNPTGILIDNAMNLAIAKLPFYDNSQIYEIIEYAQNFLLSLGLTEIVDMDLDPYLINSLRNFDELRKLHIFVNSFVKAQNKDYIKYIKAPFFGNNFSIIGTKFYADGALGSRGAALHEPYLDDVNGTGLLLINKTDFITKAINALEKGFAVAIHSIGDRATSFVLNSFEKLIKDNFNLLSNFKEKQISPLRIEHCQMIRTNDLIKAKELNSVQKIIASIQPIHFQSDFSSGMAQARIGIKRLEYSYPWKSLFDADFLVVSGSDAPIESPNPLLGIFNLIFNLNNTKQNISPEIALETYIDNAYKSIGALNRGAIEVDKIANITILPDAFLDLIYNKKNVNSNNMQKSFENLNVISTIVNGKSIYNYNTR